MLAARAANTKFFALSRKRDDRRQVRRRHHRLDRAGIFHRVLLAASAAGRRAHCSAHDGAVLARYPDRPALATPAAPNAPFMRAVADQPGRRACHRRSPPSTAASASSPIASCRSSDVYVTVGVDADAVRSRALAARHGEPSDLRHSGDARDGRPRPDGAAPHREAPARRRSARREATEHGAAPGAEDGGGRPADRRHRARLQQPADRRSSAIIDIALRRIGDERRAHAAARSTSRARPPSAPPR